MRNSMWFAYFLEGHWIPCLPDRCDKYLSTFLHCWAFGFSSAQCCVSVRWDFLAIPDQNSGRMFSGLGIAWFFYFGDGWAGAVRHAMWHECDEWHRTEWEQQTGQKKVAACFSSGHWMMGLTLMASLEPFNSVLMEAKVILMTYNMSERSLSFQWVLFLSLLWSHCEFLSFRCNRWTSLYGGTRSSARAFTWERCTQTLWWQLWSFSFSPSVPRGMVKAPCIRTCHSVSEPSGFRQPHTSAHSPGTPPGRHNGVGPGGTGDNKARFSEAEAKSLSRSPSQPRDRYRIYDGIRRCYFQQASHLTSQDTEHNKRTTESEANKIKRTKPTQKKFAHPQSHTASKFRPTGK